MVELEAGRQRVQHLAGNQLVQPVGGLQAVAAGDGLQQGEVVASAQHRACLQHLARRRLQALHAPFQYLPNLARHRQLVVALL